jgi:hypothetical protein
MTCGCLNEWMCDNYTEVFSAGYVCHQTPGCLPLYVILDLKRRRILKAKPIKKNVLHWTTQIFISFLKFLSPYIWATFLKEEALDIYFFFTGDFSLLDLKMVIFTSLRLLLQCLVHGGLWLSFFMFIQLSFLNENNCVEQRVLSAVRLPVTRVSKTYSDRIRNCVMDSKISKWRQDKYTEVSFCLFC